MLNSTSRWHSRSMLRWEVCVEESLSIVTEHARKKQEETRMQMIWDESLESLHREDSWFKAIQSGTENDLAELDRLLCEDPNRFYFDDDPRKLINSGRKAIRSLCVVDSQNRTALYLACTECNLRIVKYLLKRKANPRIACMIDEKNEETPLGCSIRWGYISLVSR